MSDRTHINRGITQLAIGLMALVISLMLLPGTALAEDYSIDRVDIDASVKTDGSVVVQESRLFDFDYDAHGVYWDIPYGAYEGRQIGLQLGSVGEIVDGQYVEYEQDYSGRNYTYQITDYGSLINLKLYSAHSYEEAIFVINYTYTNLAVRHDDVSDLYWKFVSDGWDVESENVTCTVHLPVPEGKQVEPEENVRAWGHGPLDGSVRFEGNDVIYQLPGVGTSEFAEARITFPAEWLSDAGVQSGRVLQDILAEERAWADEANARRQRAKMLIYGGSGVGLVGAIASIIASIVALVRYRRSHKPHFDDKYFRDVPSNDHPAVLGALYRGGSPNGEDFTATLMHLTDMGVIKLEEVTLESKGLLRSKQTKDYQLSLTPKAEEMELDVIDRRALVSLFNNIGRRAPSQKGTEYAGSTLFFSDLEKVAKKHPETYHDAFENWNARVEAQVASRQFFKSSEPTGKATAVIGGVVSVALAMATVFMMMATEAWAICIPLIILQIISCVTCFSIASSMRSVSKEAIELRAKLVALREWLEDFTLLEEAVPRDVVLWNRLLVMAVVLGVADEVIKQLKTVAPEILENPALAPTYGWYYMGPSGRPYERFNSDYDSAHHVSAAALAASSSSSGGGGGGGFSGGGGGGFGGGGGGGAF